MTDTQAPDVVVLRPCPFCGDDEFLILANTLLGDHSYWGVECGCHVYGPKAILREDAIAAWNTRAALSQGDTP